MKRVSLVVGLAALMALFVDPIGAAWEFSSPADGWQYSTTSGISFFGMGGTNLQEYDVEVYKNGYAEGLYSDRAGFMGWWTGTVQPPVYPGWTPDSGTPDHIMFVRVNGTLQLTHRTVEILP